MDELDVQTSCHITLLDVVNSNTSKHSITLNEMVLHCCKRLQARQSGINIQVNLNGRMFLQLRLAIYPKSPSWKS